MDIETLRTFVRVARRGSFAVVARDCGTDPSSISRAIASLEEELQVRLLQHSTRSMTLTEAGAKYLARVEPLLEELEQARDQALLTSAKPTLFCQTQHRALPSLRKRAAHPEVELHPAAAAARGIGAGDWVSIETPEGRVRARARLNDTLDPRVVVGEHGWWQACHELGAPGYDAFGPLGANFNLLIGSTAMDPISGTASHRSYLCEIRRAVNV